MLGASLRARQALVASGPRRPPKYWPAPLAFALLSFDAAAEKYQAAFRCGKQPAIPKLISPCVLVSAADRRHILNMTPIAILRAASTDHAIAVARWDDDGGAARNSSLVNKTDRAEWSRDRSC